MLNSRGGGMATGGFEFGHVVAREVIDISSAKRALTPTMANAIIGVAASQVVAYDRTRESVTIFNNDDSNYVYIGYDDTVTTADGMPIIYHSNLTIEGYAGPIYAIADGAGTGIRYEVCS